MSSRKKKNHVPVSHVTSGNVIDELGFSPEEAEAIKLKIELHLEILRLIKQKNLSSRQLERIFDVPQPRVSELLNGKISKMSLEKLASYLFRLGRKIKIVSKPRRLTSDDKDLLAA